MKNNSHIPATVLIALLQLIKSGLVHQVWLKTNGADHIRLSETCKTESIDSQIKGDVCCTVSGWYGVGLSMGWYPGGVEALFY